MGGSKVRRVETLADHGRCCFVLLLGYQPLTDGVCDDVLDVIEGIAGETVIELMLLDIDRWLMWYLALLLSW
jgi:hypothetical protein